MKFLSYIPRAIGSELRNWNTAQLRMAQSWRKFAALIIIGVITAFVSFFFERTVRWAEHTVLNGLIGYETPLPAYARTHTEVNEYKREVGEWRDAGAPKRDPDASRVNRWMLLVFPMLGGALVGLICYGMAARFKGDGTEVTVHAIHHHAGDLPIWISARKLFASVITATVGSSGQEGPITQAGAGVGSAVAKRFKFDPDIRRRCVIAGMAAGVGALFRVPLGGALYATEVLYKENEFESDALMPSFIAAIVSYSVYCPLAGEGWGPLFWMPENLYTVPLQLIFYVVLAFVLAIAGVIFAKFFEFSKFTLFNPKIFPGWTRPAMGGLVLGCIAFFFPYVLGSGYGYLQGALLNEFTIKFCLLLAVLKIIATGVTLGSGNAGGLFAPSLVIGGMLGAVGGMIGQRLGIIDDPSQVVLVGMAGFFGGVSKTPISTLLMVSEMTLGYGLLVPLMTVTALTYLLMPRALSACASQPLNRKDSPAHRGDYIIDILRNLKVSDIVKTSQVPPMVSQETTLSELNMLFTRTNHEAIPVLDADGKMDGILLLSDIKEHLLMLELGGLVVAADISRHDLQPIRLDANASDALGTLFAGGIDELPVVQGEGKTEEDVVGSISRRDIISVYHRQMNQLTKTTADTEMLELSKQTAR